MNTACSTLVHITLFRARVGAGARRVSRQDGALRSCTSISFLRPVMVAILGSLLVGQIPAQTFTVLHNFSAVSGPTATNNDGAVPFSGLTLSGNTLYGMTAEGGPSGAGTLFAMRIGSINFSTLHSFTDFEGSEPQSEVILSGNSVYGTTFFGGDSGNSGTVFKVNADGTGFTTLHTFKAGNGQGAHPRRLVLSGDTLYGVTMDEDLGGGAGLGTVFGLSTDGTGFTTLYRFKDDGDGQGPCELLLSGSRLYGAAGGIYPTSTDTVFSVNTDGTGFAILHGFPAVWASSTNSSGYHTNSGGSSPGRLILSGNTLYGTTWQGGRGGNGALFRLDTDGTGFAVIHDFASWTGSDPSFVTNSDGAHPSALALSGNTLYGTASSAGLYGGGTVFAVNADGTGFQVLHQFSPISQDQNGGFTNTDGAEPYGLLLSGNNLYGTTSRGGTEGSGTIFGISLPIGQPPLAITTAGSNVILSWPTNSTGFRLQSTTDLGSPLWITSVLVPNVVDGQNTVSDPISSTQRFYRLAP